VAAPAAGELLLAGRGIGRRYGARVALEPLDVEVRAGETTVLVGPNGAGKSTLLALLAGAVTPSAGAVATALPATAIGWAPQRPAQYGGLSARENLLLFARLQRLADPAAEAERMLDALELPGDDRRSAELSVGNQQRLNLALAFLGDPRVLLLDEPTASLDPAHARGLLERVEEARLRGAGVVLSTHLVPEAERAGRILVLREGRVVYSGPPGAFREAG
jgi:ABC-2 type transport system ATP-binding protein